MTLHSITLLPFSFSFSFNLHFKESFLINTTDIESNYDNSNKENKSTNQEKEPVNGHVPALVQAPPGYSADQGDATESAQSARAPRESVS